MFLKYENSVFRHDFDTAEKKACEKRESRTICVARDATHQELEEIEHGKFHKDLLVLVLDFFTSRRQKDLNSR